MVAPDRARARRLSESDIGTLARTRISTAGNGCVYPPARTWAPDQVGTWPSGGKAIRLANEALCEAGAHAIRGITVRGA
jgi:hypothetical protein